MKKEMIVQDCPWFRSVLLLVVVGGWCSLLTTSAFGTADPGPCAASSESRQLDFWLGDWTSADPASGGGNSKVSLSLDKCLFTEHWDGGKGHVTDKMFAYSPEDKSWYGMFADNDGRVHVFVEGKVQSGSAEFRGRSRGPKGEAILNRLNVTRVAPNKVAETWEKSTDNGASWTTAYRAEYVRDANP